MKITMICNTDGALYVFRKPLIKKLLESGHAVNSICPDGEYIGKLAAMGVSTRLVEFDRHSMGVAGNMKILLGLFGMLRTEKPAIVHNFTHKPAVFGTIAAALSGVDKIFVTVTGLGTLFSNDDVKSKSFRTLLLLQYKLALLFADKVFFQNRDDYTCFVERRILSAEKAILTNGSGVDLREHELPTADEERRCRTALEAELGTRLEGKIVLLFPARAVREKGFFEFYESARLVNARTDRYVFMHLGLVDLHSSRKVAREDIDRLSGECGVFFLGFKENIKDYMNASDIVVLPSYREGVPRSLIEGLALDKFIITTDVPGCRETVIDGWNGRTCPPKDAHGLAGVILNTDRRMLAECKGRSRELCEKKFDVENLIRVTFENYFGACGWND